MMRVTKLKCHQCGNPLIDVSLVGGEPQLICSSQDCPGRIKDSICLKCGSKEKSVTGTGKGFQNFICHNCGNTWDSFL